MTGILQVVQLAKTDSFRTTGAGWQAVTGLSQAITPSSAANQIILSFKLNIGSDGSNGVGYRVTRNGTPIDIGDAASNRTRATGVTLGTVTASDSGVTICEEFVDSPASAVAVTYAIEVNRGSSASACVNRGETDSDTASFFRTTSNLILQEFEP